MFYCIFSALCHKNIFCKFWQATHHSYEDEAFTEERVFNCTLLRSCELRDTSVEYPIVTNSGERTCQPDPFRRRKCEPACPCDAPYCHGRCRYKVATNAIGCLFHPCSSSPYKEEGGATCAQKASEVQEGVCLQSCTSLATDEGVAACQSCIEENIPGTCQDLSGAPCWHCSALVLERWEQCLPPGVTTTTTAATAAAVESINCINQAVDPSCQKCICTLLCYWSPTDNLCKSCVSQTQFAELFLHHQQCPQGWVYAAGSETCLKSFDQEKPWTRADNFCKSGGGRLAQPTSSANLQTVLESINMVATTGEYWLGAKGVGPGIGGWGAYYWTGDNSNVDNGNWANGYPLSGSGMIILTYNLLTM